MTRVLRATCEGKVVTSQGVEVEADILSEGEGASEGALLLDRDLAIYLASNAKDIKEALGRIASALESVASGLEALDTQGFIIEVVGQATGVESPPVASGDISAIQDVKAELEELMERLK